MSCIFCHGSATDATVAHIFPRSLGGGDWAVLPPRLECSNCNQYFGSKVEPLALGSFPLQPFRLLMQIPTAKRRPPRIETHLGSFQSTGRAGYLGFEPAHEQIAARVNDGKINQVRILAECTQPLAISRMLLKMGVEVVAKDDPSAARDRRYDDARQFARRPSRGSRWWFLIVTDHDQLFTAFRRGLTHVDWTERVGVEVSSVDDAEVCVLRLPYLTLMSPMHRDILPPDMASLPEPDFRLIMAQA